MNLLGLISCPRHDAWPKVSTRKYWSQGQVPIVVSVFHAPSLCYALFGQP